MNVLFICCQCSKLYLIYIQTFKRHKSEIFSEPAAMHGPPLCITGSHFCLSDYSACCSYAWETSLMEESDRKHMCTLSKNKYLKPQTIWGRFECFFPPCGCVSIIARLWLCMPVCMPGHLIYTKLESWVWVRWLKSLSYTERFATISLQMIEAEAFKQSL